MSNALIKFHTNIHHRLTSEKGATMVEYGLMVAVIAMVVVIAAATLGTNLSTMFGKVSTKLGAVG